MALEGELVLLREERPEDMAPLVELRNDLETQAWSKTLPPDYTLPMYMKRFEAREFSFERNDGRFILLKRGGEFAGTISYSGCGHASRPPSGSRSRSSGVRFCLRRPGNHAQVPVQELGLRVVRLYTHSGNPRAVSLAEKSGFRVSARQRQAIFKNGELYDNLMMDLLREEYFACHPDQIDHLPSLV
jgi:RimJ/RimL family protein N-acetyltransferase